MMKQSDTDEEMLEKVVTDWSGGIAEVQLVHAMFAALVTLTQNLNS